MKMTEQQKQEYKLYRKECKSSGVEPVRADFLAGEIPSCVTYQLGLQRRMNEQIRPQAAAMASAAGA
jgi:hypothetical protein